MEKLKREFINVIESNHGLIRRLCRAYYRSVEDQKDAFQDIVLQLWKSFETFRGDSKVSTWIYKVALNTILAKLRKNERQIITEAINTEMSITTTWADDDLELLHIVIGSLEGHDKAIVILYLEGYKNNEMAQILNLTTTNVSTRLNRIKTELKLKIKNPLHELKQP